MFAPSTIRAPFVAIEDYRTPETEPGLVIHQTRSVLAFHSNLFNHDCGAHAQRKRGIYSGEGVSPDVAIRTLSAAS